MLRIELPLEVVAARGPAPRSVGNHRIGRAQVRPHVAPPLGAAGEQLKVPPAARAALDVLGDLGVDFTDAVLHEHLAKPALVAGCESGNHDFYLKIAFNASYFGTKLSATDAHR